MRDIVFRTIMLKGASGNDIVSIEKTSTQGAVDTYTITLSDGSTETFNVTNGTSIASIEKTSTSGLIDTYTITLTDGSTSTFEVANGENAQVYEIPKDSVIGFDSEDATPAGYNEISSPYDAALSATSDNAVQNKAVKAAIDTINTKLNSLEYKRGDVIDLRDALYTGAFSGGRKSIIFYIPLNRPIASNVTNVTIANSNIEIRHSDDSDTYLIPSGSGGMSDYGTVTAKLDMGRKGIFVTLALTNAITTVTNNAVVVVRGYTTFTATLS